MGFISAYSIIYAIEIILCACFNKPMIPISLISDATWFINTAIIIIITTDNDR